MSQLIECGNGIRMKRIDFIEVAINDRAIVHQEQSLFHYLGSYENFDPWITQQKQPPPALMYK